MQFPLHPNMAEWVRPRLNRQNPHELHWRRETPEWHGSIDKTHGHLYSHLAQETCCMQCGAIPCPFDHDEHKRLKLADLEFVKELAKERRELRETVTKLEKILRNMESKQMEWKAERMLMMEKLRHYEHLEKDWQRQKMLMEGEIDRLKMLNTDNMKKLQNYKKDQEKLRKLTKRVQDLENQNASLQEENKKFRQLIVKQSDEIQSLENTNKDLIKQNEESHVHITRLRVKLDETCEDLVNARNALENSRIRMRELEAELARLGKELTDKTREFFERDQANLKLLKELKNEIARLKELLLANEDENRELTIQLNIYLQEIEKLRARLSSDTRFRKFVNIKRECNDLKEQNDTLMVKVHEHQHNCVTIPMMNATGRVKSAPRGRSPPSRRPDSSKPMLNRPKSSRTLGSFENEDDG